MRLAFSFLADYALAHGDGRIYVIGGGFTGIYAATFPYDHPQLSLVARVEFDVAEVQPMLLSITLVNASGEETAPKGQISLGWERGTFAPDEPRAIHVVAGFQQLHFTKPGAYSFNLFLGPKAPGRKIGSIPFSVKKASPVERSATP
jgi:hypothetical protein